VTSCLSVCLCLDLPSIFSGRGIGFIDPHEQFFKTDGPRPYPTSSYMWDLIAARSDIVRLADQFAPFIQPLFGVTAETFETGYFNGTVFRFPLRMQAGQSDLCQTVYSAQKVKDLFNSLEADAHDLLLFLKSLRTIEVYEKLSDENEPKMLMTVRVSSAAEEEVKSKRAELIEQINELQTGCVENAVSVLYAMTTELVRQQPLEPEMTTRNWLISQFYGGTADVSSMKEYSDALGLLPWVAVALPVKSTEEVSGFRDRPGGHVFCFLPLPREPESPTGLRVHVHGYFAVDQNRRHIKTRTAEQMSERITDKAILWNEFLISSLLPKALVGLALYVAGTWSTESALLRRDLIFSVIPDTAAVTVHWKPLVDEFFRELPSLPVFYSPADQGRFLQMKDVCFDSVEDTSCLTELIRRILLLHQTDLVSVPEFVMSQLGSAAARVSARTVCMALKDIEPQLSLTDDDRMILLTYLVDGLGSDVEELVGAQLLPLADGTWVEFRRCTDDDPVYIDSEEHQRSLLPGLDRLFVIPDATDMCKRIMSTAKPSKR